MKILGRIGRQRRQLEREVNISLPTSPSSALKPAASTGSSPFQDGRFRFHCSRDAHIRDHSFGFQVQLVRASEVGAPLGVLEGNA